MLERIAVTRAEGVRGDYRGMFNPRGRNRRQVTVMAVESWREALVDLGTDVPWQERRVNLMIEGIDLFDTARARLRFAGGVVLDIVMECDPCFRMDRVAPGLKAALTPRWRGGICARVAGDGDVAIGDEVGIERI